MQAKSLSNLEQKVMEIVWKYRECSVRVVHKQLNKRRKLAYTTVATILQRLFDKGLVQRKRQGLAYIYSPKLSKELYSKSLAGSFLHKFINSFGDVAIASFAASIESLPKRKRDYFIKLLEEYEKNQ